ncbi:MAG TPA: NAD-dependent epimerase/dehydratase family protein [Puia sp.]|nr:NAD-dependent epimerase/dehydratase family protein [Puia sp.]
MIFLTGGTGFIGSYILTELVRQGYSVRALRRRPALPFFLSPEIAAKTEWVEGDVLDVSSLQEQLTGCDRIIHAAAIVSFYPDEKRAMFRTNIEGTANLVNIALEQGIDDFIYISSVAALGRTDQQTTIDEEKKWESGAGQTNYAISKYHAEMEVWRGMGEGLRPLVLNPSTVLGFGDWNRGSCAIFRSVYQEYPWYTSGHNGFVDVEDIARVVVALMNSPVRNQRFIVSAENRGFRDLFNKIADEFQKKHPSLEVNSLLASLAWRAEKVKSLFTGTRPLLTKETASIASKRVSFDNSRLLNTLPDFRFTPLDDTIRHACAQYLRHVNGKSS